MPQKRKFYDPIVIAGVLTVSFTILKEVGKAIVSFVTYTLLKKWWEKRDKK